MQCLDMTSSIAKANTLNITKDEPDIEMMLGISPMKTAWFMIRLLLSASDYIYFSYLRYVGENYFKGPQHCNCCWWNQSEGSGHGEVSQYSTQTQ